MTGDQLPSHFSKKLTERLDVDFALQAAGLGVWELDPITNVINWDDQCRKLFGLAHDRPLPYEQAVQYIHPDDVTRVREAVQGALNPASAGVYDFTYRTLGADDGVLRWVRFVGQCTFTQQGNPYRFAGIAQDVTGMMITQKKESVNERFKHAIEQAPMAILILKGKDMVLETANPAMLKIMDRGIDSIGQPLEAIMPELSGQALLAICRQVYERGEPYFGWQQPAQLERGGQVETAYFNVSYTPFYEDQRITGVMQVVSEVTEQVQARLALEAKDRDLARAIEIGQLGTFKIDLQQATVTYSDRIRIWWGLSDNQALIESFFSRIVPEDRSRVKKVLEHAQVEASGGRYDLTYRITNPYTGQPQYLHSIGQSEFVDGRASSISGIIQDVTAQVLPRLELEASEARFRSLAAQLEQLVERRTEELATVNEELTASNEELLASYDEMATANEQLNEANRLLSRSNDNLQQFAYIASHDLQEPLRKIQSFGQLLQDQHTERLGDGVDYLKRMQSAASRMSTLIRDLLVYSRIAMHQENRGSVSLNTVVDLALIDLDLLISETNAVVEVELLPTVVGDASQLGQLFQNLVNNALKFRRSDVAPTIQITWHFIKASELPPYIKPTRQARAYHRIDVADNGIGFDTRYTDRIFQVFQRLHGKSTYSGSGIGLAICERVATNHGGAITADSQPGQGATFSVYLPNGA